MLFGAPGVGKGTYGKLIQREFGFPTFSMGDYFRKVINEDSSVDDPEHADFVTRLRETLRSGQFVDDAMAIEVIKNARETQFADTDVVIFDGMPRTVPQARLLAESGISVDLIFNFTNRMDILLEKLMGRRVCPNCNRNYNVAHIDRDGYYMKALLPEKDPHICDDCPGVKLVVRDDDKENIIMERMKIYEEKTEPILSFYKEKPETIVIDFEAKRGVDDFPKMKQLLEDSLARL